MDHEPPFVDWNRAEAVGLEPTRALPLPVFKTGSSSGRMTSSSCGGWNRTNALLVQSQALLPAATTPQCFRQIESHDRRKVRGGGFEPPSPVSKAGSLPLADPRECPTTALCGGAGVEPACPAWKAGAFAARPRARIVSRRKERESNPQGSSLDGFRNRCHRQLACPSVKLRRQESNLCRGG